MNKAQRIREVFEPSPQRPVPPYHIAPREEDSQYFTYSLTLARGSFSTGITYNVYDIGMVYTFSTQNMNVHYTKNLDVDAHHLLEPRTFQEIKDDTHDLYQVFRVMSQMIMDIRRTYTVRYLTFSVQIRFAELLKQFDRFVYSMAHRFNGTIYPTRRETDTYGEVHQGYVIRLPLPGLGTRIRNRFRSH